MNSPFEEYEDTEQVKKERRYYWLKLKEGFFEDRYIKILKVQTNGYRVLAIYLMLQLKALKSDGILEYSRILPSHTAELAIEIGEPEEVVAEAIQQLVRCGLVELWGDDTVFMTAKREIIDYGSEGASAERVRRARERRRALHCND